MTTQLIPGIDQSTVTPVLVTGTWSTRSGSSLEVRSPFDNELLGKVPALSPSDVDDAVAYAHRALETSPLPQWQRAEILDRAAVLLASRREEFGVAIARESAKPIKTARVEVDRAVSTLQFSAAVARTLAGEVVPLEASPVGVGKLGFIMRVPVGVVGAIAPFNFPLNLVVHKVGPAIAAGCPVVLKPASQTPFSSILLARLLEEAGLPDGYLQVVTGGGGTVGNALVDNPNVALITFTGSPDVGWGIRARAPRKRVGLELGNNAPVVIEADGDWKTAAAKIKIAGFSHAGQSCISTQRILVHRSIADAFVAELVAGVQSLVVGDPMDDATDVSALISVSERDRVAGWIAEAVADGGSVACGGTLDANGVLMPTVIVGANPQMSVCAKEVFGPVVAVQVYDYFDDALRIANDTDFGLQAAVFTADITKGLKAARTLDFGGVLINEVPTWRTDQMPYGGLRDSGNTKEGPAWSVREMTEEKLVILHG
jgi:acyl-CoA reductase-like NAD-dependent aldehyde dehydrogenase